MNRYEHALYDATSDKKLMSIPRPPSITFLTLCERTAKTFIKSHEYRRVDEIFISLLNDKIVDYLQNYIEEFIEASEEAEIESWKDGDFDYLLYEGEAYDDHWIAIDNIVYTVKSIRELGIEPDDYIERVWQHGYYCAPNETLLDSSGYIGEIEVLFYWVDHPEFEELYDALPHESKEELADYFNRDVRDIKDQRFYGSINGYLMWCIDDDQLRFDIEKALKAQST